MLFFLLLACLPARPPARQPASAFLCLPAVSVDYLTRPIEVFKEMHRCLKPGGMAVMSFSNRCFPTKGEHAAPPSCWLAEGSLLAC